MTSESESGTISRSSAVLRKGSHPRKAAEGLSRMVLFPGDGRFVMSERRVFAEAERAATEGMPQAFLDALAAGDFEQADAVCAELVCGELHEHTCRDCGEGFDCDGYDGPNGCDLFDGSCPECHEREAVES